MRRCAPDPDAKNRQWWKALLGCYCTFKPKRQKVLRQQWDPGCSLLSEPSRKKPRMKDIHYLKLRFIIAGYVWRQLLQNWVHRSALVNGDANSADGGCVAGNLHHRVCRACKLQDWVTSVAPSAMVTDRKTVKLLVRDSLPETVRVSKQNKVRRWWMMQPGMIPFQVLF